MKKTSVCILDYGSGNVKSAYHMLKLLADKVVISNDESKIKSASHLVLPGVGAFGASMDKIKEKIPLAILEAEVLKKKKPFLGICVGMQVLGTTGFEFGKHAGLGWIDGEVKKIKSKNLPLPHIGWNNVKFLRNSPLTNDFPKDLDFYFVHSFALTLVNKQNIVATTNYSLNFCSIVQKENIFGVQFHPEKSQKAGKILLENFLKIKQSL